MARRDILRTYDHAVRDFFRAHLNTLNGIDMAPRVVFASPERPFGFELQRTKEGDLDEARMMQTLNTPLVSITRLSPRFSLQRNNTVRRRFAGWYDDNKTFAVRTQAPRPFDIPYQLDIHGRFREDCNWVLQWFLYHPDPVHAFQVDFGVPYGVKWIDMIFNEIIDNSELETGENARWIRHTVPFILEAYMFDTYDSLADLPMQSITPDADTGDPAGAISSAIRTVKKITTTEIVEDPAIEIITVPEDDA